MCFNHNINELCCIFISNIETFKRMKKNIKIKEKNVLI